MNTVFEVLVNPPKSSSKSLSAEQRKKAEQARLQEEKLAKLFKKHRTRRYLNLKAPLKVISVMLPIVTISFSMFNSLKKGNELKAKMKDVQSMLADAEKLNMDAAEGEDDHQNTTSTKLHAIAKIEARMNSGPKWAVEKLVSSVLVAGSPGRNVKPPDKNWHALFTCSTYAAWNAHRSQTFESLPGNLAVLYFKNKVFIYTPFYAGSQQVFTGIAWHKPVEKLSRLVALNLDKILPSQYFSFPVQMTYEDQTYWSHAYKRVRRDGYISDYAHPMLGEAVPPLDDVENYSEVRAKSLMWENFRPLVADDAVKALLAEIDAQILRSEKPNRKPVRSFLSGAANPKEEEMRVHQACKESGASYQRPHLSRAAMRQLRALNTTGMDAVRSGFTVKDVQTSDGYPEGLVYAHVGVNFKGFEDCARVHNIASDLLMPTTFILGSTGDVKDSLVRVSVEGQRGFSNCLQSQILAWQFPQPKDGVQQQVDMVLNFRN